MRRMLFVLSAAFWLASTLVAADWPMYRGDAGRTGYTAETLPAGLSLRWSFCLRDAPQPAWPRSQRMLEDRAFQVAVAGGTVFFGNSADDKVYALDAASGRRKWTFTTDAPVRFAPAAWKDRLFVASDDGHLYALSADGGRLLWKRRGGPDDRSVLGNGRMISKWPARGGPVVVGDLVYFAAGIWPSDGIYLYALDAASGKVVWTNSDSGGITMAQPHGGAVAESGVSAQGYLVATADRLLVPTGRAVPAVFDRQSGRFQYFHLQRFGRSGQSPTMASGTMFFNGGTAYDLAGGANLCNVGHGPLAATPGGLALAAGDGVTALTLTPATKPDRRGEPTATIEPKQRWATSLGAACSALIVAGEHVVAGSAGKVSMLDLETGNVICSADVEGSVYGLAATGQGLFVSTDRGTIHGFAAGEPARDQQTQEQAREQAPVERAGDRAVASPYGEGTPAAKAAEEIIARSGVREGYCVDLGCGDGALAYHLARHTGLLICAVDDDPDRVALARKKLDAAGLYGTRVTVHHRDLSASGYPDYFANLVVSGRSVGEGPESLREAEARRLQRPCGGTICVGRPGSMTPSRRGPLAGAGRWTHQYGDPANTVCSDDRLVKGSLSMLWFGDVDFAMPSRHGRAPGPLFAEGRLFQVGLDGVVAVDAYNGHVLWKYEIEGLLKPYDGDELMGTAGTGSNACFADGSVYVRHEGRCVRLDAATGKPLAEFPVPRQPDGKPGTWGYVACDEGILYGSVADPRHVVTYRYINRGGDMQRLLTESQRLFALDAETGRSIWQYEAKHSLRHNAIALADSRVFLIDRPEALFDREKKPRTKDHPLGLLVALDAATGEELWRQDEEIYGTTLAAGARHNVLLMSYQPTRFRLDSELGGRMAAFSTVDGRRLWDIRADYQSRPIINDRTIYAQGGAWDLLTGKAVPFAFQRSYGCGILASGAHMLLFRSATLGYYDLSGARRTENYGGARPGCWINAIAAGGLVLVPDATAGCTCSYLNKAWFALQPEDGDAP
ncbi:MAG: PQQ-binding-like beta-propeller repeat protein [Pirellulales bacterium]|nr:PQQ-binding-like beta-propeller repeat protein [Pirellulales bacterium]